MDLNIKALDILITLPIHRDIETHNYICVENGWIERQENREEYCESLLSSLSNTMPSQDRILDFKSELDSLTWKWEKK